jgi:apolipoprotein N-acyltransferase
MTTNPAPASDTFRGRADALADQLAALTGWRRYAMAAALGTIATLALPPIYLMPVLYPAFAGLVWLLPGRLARVDAFFTGWWFGMGYFASSLYWIGFAPVTFSASLWWLVPAAIIVIPGILSVFHGVATLAASRLGGGHLRRALVLTLAWGITEWLRGHIFTGLPWNLAGYGWIGSGAMAQAAAVFGMYGVTVLAVASATLAAGVAGGSPGRRMATLGVAVAIPLAAWAGGMIRLAGAPEPGADNVPGVGLRIVQANIPQKEKWSGQLIQGNFDLHRRLSVEGRPDWITHLIWPETAAVIDLTRYPDWAEAASQAIPPGGLLLTGTPRRVLDPPQVWNSMVAVDSQGNITGGFDKFHLVPFGEYMPMRSILPFEKITAGMQDFSAGPGPGAVRLKGLPPVGPLICYEVIFPGEVVDPANRPDWLLNLTNDAWYGQTAGPHQHLAIARLRAIEEGLPLVRSANTGISAVFDAYGREIARLGLNEQGALDVELPRPLTTPTLYGRYGDFAFLFLTTLAFLSLLRVPNN